MLCMRVPPFGYQATTSDNVPWRDRGFSVCEMLSLLCARHAPAGSGGRGRCDRAHINLKSIRSPLDAVWLTGSQHEHKT